MEATQVDAVSILKNIIPSDLVSPIQKMDMLQVLFVSILFGVAMNLLRDQLSTVRQFAAEMNQLCSKIVTMIVLVVLTSILLSVGAPGVAGTAFICLTTVVVSLGMPAETATFVLGIDSLLTMFRVTHNVVGDIAATTAVAASENILNREIYSN